ncbi:MAG: hypothetical protein MOIL_01081 [Candidatus Methanolliviera sp. GoM_oil]|nr:MAG: hypothetical protein MOIL_01081 [Candidatus Methanolliviera sp. GoM_oil]
MKEYYILTAKDFYDGLREDKIFGLRCKECGQITCPPLPTCQWCGSKDLEKTELSGMGEILTFTLIDVSPEGFEPHYIICMVKLDEGPTIMGRLDYDAEKATVKNERSQELIGMKVKASHVVLPADVYSGGEKIVPLFKAL